MPKKNATTFITLVYTIRTNPLTKRDKLERANSGPIFVINKSRQRSADFRYPDGETGKEACSRIAAFLEEKRLQHGDENILFVSHERLSGNSCVISCAFRSISVEFFMSTFVGLQRSNISRNIKAGNCCASIKLA